MKKLTQNDWIFIVGLMVSFIISSINYYNLQKARSASQAYLENTLRLDKMIKFKEYLIHLADQVEKDKDLNSYSNYQMIFDKDNLVLFNDKIANQLLVLNTKKENLNIKKLPMWKNEILHIIDQIEKEISILQHQNLIVYHQGQSILFDSNSMISYFSIFISIILIIFYERISGQNIKTEIITFDQNHHSLKLLFNDEGFVYWFDEEIAKLFPLFSISNSVNFWGHLDLNFSFHQKSPYSSVNEVKRDFITYKKIKNLYIFHTHSNTWFQLDLETIGPNPQTKQISYFALLTPLTAKNLANVA